METLKINDDTVIVKELPEALQNEVALYEHVLIKLMEAQKEMAVLEMARNTSTQVIATNYQKYVEEEAKAKEDSKDDSEDSTNVG